MSAIGICLTVAVITAIFPLFLTVYISADKNDKSFKLAFSLFGITLFRYNAIISGFTWRVKKTFKKPYSVNLYDLLKKPAFTGVNKLQKIGVLSVELITDIGASEASFVAAISSINIAETVIFGIIKSLKPNVKINNELNVYYNSEVLRVILRVKAVFNILDLLTVFLLNLWGLKNAIGKQNKQRCRKRA